MNIKATLCLLAAVAIPVAAKAQAVITFNINGTEGATSYSQTEDGVTMTWTNPTESGNVFAFGVMDDGSSNNDLDLSAPGAFVNSFNFSFSSSVKIVSYTVGVVSGSGSATFSLSDGISAFSSGNDLTTTGSHLINGDFTIGADVLGLWDTTITPGTYPTIRSITVTTVPEPGTYTLMAGLAGAAFVIAKRRRQKNLPTG